MEDSPAVEKLTKLTNFKSERIKELKRYRYQIVDDPYNLYVSTSNLVFKLTSDDEAELVFLDEGFEFDGDIVVPEKVFIYGVTYSVTSIGSSAFDGCRNLENVTLPASITRIGDNAFAYCKNLQLETLPESLEIIDVHAFANCENLRLKKLPTNLRRIDRGAFINCVRLQLETLPANLREIYNDAFDNCRDLQLETLPEGLEIIGREAFKYCTNLKLKALPDNLHEIGEGAFYGCGKFELKKQKISLSYSHFFFRKVIKSPAIVQPAVRTVVQFSI